MRPDCRAHRYAVEELVLGAIIHNPILRDCRCLSPQHFTRVGLAELYCALRDGKALTSTQETVAAGCAETNPDVLRFHAYVDALLEATC